ncbi:MAG: GntR family transcriptional regulator [Trueperaceae bacterium]|nr:GntR family transcriptional regulator [Trueperaceae bacterium]
MTIDRTHDHPGSKPGRRKQDAVYEALRHDILEGRLAPGERLRLDDITQRLEVSHIPVREALKQLEADGYVAIEPYVGTTVAELKADWIHELFELKEALELISGRAACRRMSQQDLDDVEAVLRRMDDLVRDPEAWSASNVELHRLICTRAGTKLAGQLLDRVLNQWDRLRRYFLQEVFALRVFEAQREHWAIYHALTRRDPDELERVVRTHNRRALEAYAARLPDHD